METLKLQGKSLPSVAQCKIHGKWLEDFKLFQIGQHRKQRAKDIRRWLQMRLKSELTSQAFLVSHVNILPEPSNGLKLLNFSPEAFNFWESFVDRRQCS